jgi:hypothetical protein
VVVFVVVGLVGDDPLQAASAALAAPIMPSALRRLTRLDFMFRV